MFQFHGKTFKMVSKRKPEPNFIFGAFNSRKKRGEKAG